MNILAIADIHGQAGNLNRMDDEIEWADVIVLTGDVTNFGGREEARRVLRPLVSSGAALIAVPGNCDYPEVSQYLAELGANVDGAHQEISGIPFLGMGGALPGPGTTPNELSESEISAVLDSAAQGIDDFGSAILVSHQPPVDSEADRLPSGEHVGSNAVREFIEIRQPLVCFTGHIHESRGIGPLEATQVVNPGPLGSGYYAVAQIDDGVGLLELREVG